MNYFKRHIFEYLLDWKASSGRKPLILRGARQVGKTTVVKQLSQTYKRSIFLNIEKREDAALFEKYTDVAKLTDALFLSNNIHPSEAADTLLFIDEIQESPMAISMLRYFYEEFPALHVIAAGSLLEHALKRVKSFPVGRVSFMYLHPLNFGEFLQAINQELLFRELQKSPLNEAAYGPLLNLFHIYAIIGGMPEIVAVYAKEKSIASLPSIYESIWDTYKNDIRKYAKSDASAKIINHIINTAHLYFDQRIVFQNFGKSNYRSREVGEAFRSIDAAKIIQIIHPTTSLDVPLKPDLRKSPKMQMLDTGILNYELNIQADMLALNDLSTLYKGSLIPHLIVQELLSKNVSTYKRPMFWVREKTQSSAEVDMVYTYKNLVIPIEVKSGSSGTLKSLHQFIDMSAHHYAIRIYAGPFMIEKHKTPTGKPYILMSLPYFTGTMLDKYVAFFIENY